MAVNGVLKPLSLKQTKMTKTAKQEFLKLNSHNLRSMHHEQLFDLILVAQQLLKDEPIKTRREVDSNPQSSERPFNYVLLDLNLKKFYRYGKWVEYWEDAQQFPIYEELVTYSSTFPDHYELFIITITNEPPTGE